MVALGMLLGLLAAAVPAHLGGARDAVVAAREQRRARRRRPRPHAARHDRRAGRAVARAPQQRRRWSCAASSGCSAPIPASTPTACSRSACAARPSSSPSRPTWSGSRIASSARSRPFPASPASAPRRRCRSRHRRRRCRSRSPARRATRARRSTMRRIVDLIGTRASYVQVMGMRVVAGRAFDPVRQDGRQEALIDRRLAEQFFPNGEARSARRSRGAAHGSPPTYEPVPADGMTIVGVVDQARLYDLHQDGRPQIYVRTEDWGYRPLSFVVRTSREPDSIIAEARAALRRVDARVAMGDVRTMERSWRTCCAASARARRRSPPSRSARCCSPRWGCSASSPAR